MTAREYNFDGLVGPSHNYGGLSFGNIASEVNEGSSSNPRQAALQGLSKMRTLHTLGVPQAVFPPHMRPELSLARRMGFDGDDAKVLGDLAREFPMLLAACYSASAMWTANAATVSPSADSADGRVHFTPANLQNKLHRSIEHPTTRRILQAIFRDEDRFVVHEALPSTAALGDEGAANHTRLAPEYGARGVQLFVYGESITRPKDGRPKLYPARQTMESCMVLARLHKLRPEQVVLAQQAPEVIDQGVFHNDVISVGNRDTFFFHEKAFAQGRAVVEALAERYHAITGEVLKRIEVPEAAVKVPDAVSTYLFNSQLVTLPDGRTALIAPTECEQNDAVRSYVASLVEGDAPIDEVHYFDLRQSMQGGGGPACLRLRVVLTEAEAQAITPGVRFDDALDAKLTAWVEKRYRDRLSPADLADPQLMLESQVALDELTTLLGLGSIYEFQL
ncbi:MAG: N-succinylarginine dihydrolase [Deltaproteobacteria bacterium]|nr:N-succinylarginine dihydrolase [Deltaproteobacteria bacterium]